MIDGTHRRPARLATVLVSVAAGAALLAACGSSGSGTTSTGAKTTGVSAKTDTSVAALLPASIRSAGVLKVAVPDSSAPLASANDAGKAVGMDPDLANAVGAVLGLKVQVTATSFDSEIPGIAAGKYNVGMGEFYVTSERLKSVDFVTEWNDFSSFATSASSSYKPQTLKDLCGKRIGVLKGSAEEASIETDNSTCTPKMTVSSFPNQGASFLALSSGRIDAVVTGRGPLEAASKNNKTFKVSGKFGGGPCATAVARNGDSTKLLAALKAAYDKIIADGTYATILKKWGTDYGAAKTAAIYTKTSTPPNYS